MGDQPWKNISQHYGFNTYLKGCSTVIWNRAQQESMYWKGTVIACSGKMLCEAEAMVGTK
jgi:hypothetical protein